MRKARLSLTLAAAVFLMFVFTAEALAGGVGCAPLNEAFASYLRDKNSGAKASSEDTLPRCGYIPSPLDLSHVKPPAAGIFMRGTGAALPSKYDLRDHAGMTAVRDQGQYGTCWAFGAMASLESSFLASGAPEHEDFSEWHLSYFARVDESPEKPAFTQSAPAYGDDPIFDQGGNAWMASAILARWTGAVNEADRPYPDTKPWPESSRPLASDPVSRHLENVYYLGGVFDADTVKNAVMTDGAVTIRMQWASDSYFNSTYNSFYCPSISSSGGHAVAIAGWDDDFPKENFSGATKPATNGAWLIKNSWGSSWGDNGYFWLSYCDPNIGDPALFIGGDKTDFDGVYQYDQLGWINSLGYGVETAWFANVFTAREISPGSNAEVLKAVSFYAGASNSSYLIEIRKGVSADNPRNGDLMTSDAGVLQSAGYHTVVLREAVPLSAGKRFSVVVRLKTPGYNSPIPAEYPVASYSDKAVASTGQSFISKDGASWEDFTEEKTNGNVCLKAFISNGEPVAEKPALVSPEDGAAVDSLTPTLTAGAFQSSDPSVTHKATRWQVGTVEDFSQGVVIDVESEEFLTSIDIAEGKLRSGTRYYWRVRFKGSNGVLTDWSDTWSFTTPSSSGGGGGCNFGFGGLVFLAAAPAVMFFRKKRF